MKRVLTPSLFISYPRTQNISKVFPLLFTFPKYWIKEKLVATLANQNICDKTLNKSVLSLYYRTGNSTGELLKKRGYLMVRSLYPLSLFALNLRVAWVYIL